MAESTLPASAASANSFRLALASLHDPHYRLYWFSNALFFVGQGLILMGAQWLMLDLTSSRATLGLVGALQGAVLLLLSPLGGVLADRYPKRTILILARIVSAALFIAMGLLVLTGAVQIWHVLLSVVIAGGILAFTQATSQTYVFDLVGRERLTNAIALNSLGTSLFNVIGPSVGGALLASIGSEGTYLAGGAGYLLGAAFLFFIPVLGKSIAPKRVTSFVRSTSDDIVEGLRFVRTDRTLLWILVMSTIGFFGGALMTMRPVFAKEILDVGAQGLGWLNAAFGFGGLIGAVLVASIGARLKYAGLAIVLPQAWWMLGTLIYAVSSSYPLNLALEVGLGVGAPFFQAMLMSTIQIRAPAHIRNRVLTLHFMLFNLMNINWWVTGALADSIGDRQALFTMGAVGLTFDVIILTFGRRLSLLGTSKYPVTPISSPIP